MPRRAFRFLAVSLAALLALGCSHRQEPTKEKGAATSELTFYSALGQAEWQVLKTEIFPAFEQANGCRIRSVDVASRDIPLKLDALRQANRMNVDVIGQDNMVLAPLVQRGLMEDLTPQQAALPRTTIPALLNVGRFDGKFYFLPYRPNVEITFYNQTHLSRHGLKPPLTWPELFNVSKTLYEREGVGRVAIKADGSDGTTAQLCDFIISAGGDPLTLNDPGCIKAFTFLQGLWPYLSPESRRADFNTMNQFLAMESVYLGQNWPFGVEVIVRQGGKTNILAYHGWRGPVREAHTLGGEVLGIPKGAPHKALALKFIAYMQSREVQAALIQKLAWPSMRTDAYAEVPAWQKPYFQAVEQALAHAVARPNVPYWEDFDKAINLAFREIVVDRRDVKATLDRYAADVARARQLKSKAADRPARQAGG